MKTQSNTRASTRARAYILGVAATALALFGAACWPVASTETLSDGEAAEREAHADAGIVLSWPDGPQQVGPIPLELTVKGRTAPVVIDLLSPEMPAHGVTRYRVDAAEPGSYRVTLEIPMEGAWALYVDLGEGVDAREFPFEVQAPIQGAEVHTAHR